MISIKTLHETRTVMLVTRVIELKNQILNTNTNAKPEVQILFFKDELLDDDNKLLTEYGIKPGSVIRLRFVYEILGVDGTSENSRSPRIYYITSDNYYGIPKINELHFCRVCKVNLKSQLQTDKIFEDHKKTESHEVNLIEIFRNSLNQFSQQNNLEESISFSNYLINFIQIDNVNCDYRGQILKYYFDKFKKILLIFYYNCFQVFKMSISLNCTYSECKYFTITHEPTHVVRMENDINDNLAMIYNKLQTNLDDFVRSGINIDRINRITLSVVDSEIENNANNGTNQKYYCKICDKKKINISFFNNHKQSPGHKDKVNGILRDSINQFLMRNNLGVISFNRDNSVSLVRQFAEDYRGEIPRDYLDKFKEILIFYFIATQGLQMSISLNGKYSNGKYFTITHEPRIVRIENLNNNLDEIYNQLQTNMQDFEVVENGIKIDKINQISLTIVRGEIEKALEYSTLKTDYFQYDKFKYKIVAPFAIYVDVWPYNVNNNQEIMCYGIYIMSYYPDLCPSKYKESRYKAYFGADAAEKFVKEIEELDKEFTDLLKKNIPLDMTDEDENDFITSTNCYFCGELLGPEKHDSNNYNSFKVRDHDHYTGKYRGAAHNYCNKLATHNKFVPLYFYNRPWNIIIQFYNYITELLDLNCKPRCIRILNALNFFTPNSLEDIGSTLEEKDCQILRRYKLNEEQLLSREQFGSIISSEQYELAKQNWDSLECRNMKDYTLEHLKINVLMLADVFENFRNTCLEAYKIDPCYCYSLPHLAWLAALKHTKVKLTYDKEKTYDDLLEKGIKDCVSTVLGNRKIVFNNTQTNENFQVDKVNYLLLLDANSLSTFAMMQELPTGEMELCNDRNYEKTSDGEGNHGFVYKVHLEYPNEIKEITKHYPFLPEQHNKKNYIIEGRMLDWYLDHGIRIKATDIHKKFKYTKSNWLKPFIEFNNDKQEKGEFAEKIYELMNSAFHEKITKNIDFNLIGFTTLELSKLRIYQFIYDCIDKRIDKWEIHITDTDSIFIEKIIQFDSTLKYEVAKLEEFIHPTELAKFKDKLKMKAFIKKAIFIKSKCNSMVDKCAKDLENIDINKNN